MKSQSVPITQPVPKTGRSCRPSMCTSSLLTPYFQGCALLTLSPHSRLAENGVDLGWDGVGLGWDGVGWGGMWNGMEVLRPENHYFVNIDPLKGKLTSQREGFATFLAAL